MTEDLRWTLVMGTINMDRDKMCTVTLMDGVFMETVR